MQARILLERGLIFSFNLFPVIVVRKADREVHLDDMKSRLLRGILMPHLPLCRYAPVRLWFLRDLKTGALQIAVFLAQ